jgi:hypothetical protein
MQSAAGFIVTEFRQNPRYSIQVTLLIITLSIGHLISGTSETLVPFLIGDLNYLGAFD